MFLDYLFKTIVKDLSVEFWSMNFWENLKKSWSLVSMNVWFCNWEEGTYWNEKVVICVFLFIDKVWKWYFWSGISLRPFLFSCVSNEDQVWTFAHMIFLANWVAVSVPSQLLVLCSRCAGEISLLACLDSMVRRSWYSGQQTAGLEP